MSGILFFVPLIFLQYSFESVPYIVGVNPNSPRNPHSAMASGGYDVGAIDTDPAVEAYILYGAVIGGPDKHGRYFDIRSDWPQTEVLRLHFESSQKCSVFFFLGRYRL